MHLGILSVFPLPSSERGSRLPSIVLWIMQGAQRALLAVLPLIPHLSGTRQRGEDPHSTIAPATSSSSSSCSQSAGFSVAAPPHRFSPLQIIPHLISPSHLSSRRASPPKGVSIKWPRCGNGGSAGLPSLFQCPANPTGAWPCVRLNAQTLSSEEPLPRYPSTHVNPAHAET